MNRFRSLVLLAVFVGIVQILTMPRMLYPCEADAARMEAAHLLATGTWGIPYGLRSYLMPDVAVKGRRFFENDRQQRFFSRFGPAYTVFCLPPVLAERIWTGSLSLRGDSASQVLFLNLYQVLFAMALVVCLYKQATLFSRREGVCVLYALGSFYGSCAWFYMRNSTLDVFLLPVFHFHAYHLLAMLRCDRQCLWRHGGLAVAGVGVLSLMSPVWLALFAALGLVLVLRRGEPGEDSKDARGRWLGLGLSCAVTVSLVAILNHFRFGGVLESGGGQWLDPDGGVPGRLNWRFLADSLPALILQPGNANLFLHVPGLLLAVCGLGGFVRRHRAEAVVLAVLGGGTLLAVAASAGWADGGTSYGPRALLPVLLLAALPAVTALEWIGTCLRAAAGSEGGVSGSKRWLAGVAAAQVVGFGFLVSLELQVSMISLHGHMYSYAKQFMDVFDRREIRAYFENVPHRALVHNDLLRYAFREEPLRPMEWIRRYGTPQEQERLAYVEQCLYGMIGLNYYFSRGPVIVYPPSHVRMFDAEGGGGGTLAVPPESRPRSRREPGAMGGQIP